MEITKLNTKIQVINKIVETPIYDNSIGEDGAYVGEDIRFCNTSLATEVGKYFRKHNQYPYPPPQPKDATDKYYYQRFQESSKYSAYKEFWDEEENRRRNGIIIPGRLLPDGSIQKIHITGHHYSYLNYNLILHDDKSSSRVSKENLLKDKPKFAKTVGESKSSTPDFWDGDYHYFKAIELAKKLGLNLVVDKTRQVGYSYKNSSIAVDIYDLIPRSTTVIGAFDSDYLTTGDATYIMTKNRINHINGTTDWKKTIIGSGTGSLKEIRSGYVYSGSKIKGGFGSLIIPVTFSNDPSAARGKKGMLVIMEESGKFPNLEDSVIATNEGLREGGIVTGIMVIFGTGGGKPGHWENFEKIFYNPLDYACLPFKNIWDDNMGHTSCGFFHGRQYNLKPYYDEDGNSDLEGAMDYIKSERAGWRKSGKDELYKKNVAEKPICPKESFNAGNDNIFNTPELEEHSNKVDHDTKLHFGMHGLLLKDSGTGKLRFYQNSELKPEYRHEPITNVTRKSNEDVEGCMTIWFHPYRNKEGAIPDKLYYIVHDPYAVSKDKKFINHKDSMGCAYVYESPNNFTKGFGDRLVAKYMGRPALVDNYNKNLFLLAEYYNCKNRQIWYENNRGSVQEYAQKHGYLQWLGLETDVDSTKQGGDNSKIKNYGITIEGNRKLAAVSYLRDWLYTPRSTDDGDNVVTNLCTILDIRLLRELQRWNIEGNFDAVSTMFVLMYLVKTIQKHNTYAKEEQVSKNKNDIFNPEYLINKMK